MRSALAILMVVLVGKVTFAQGIFSAANVSAPTRLGTWDGPLAGTNILAQFFAGAQMDTLSPVGSLAFHIEGVAVSPDASVANVPAYSYAYVQMLAWNGALWGTNWQAVPAGQFGQTDVVPVFLTSGLFPDVVFRAHFNQPAIVPVPEPPGYLFVAAAMAAAVLAQQFWRGGRGRE